MQKVLKQSLKDIFSKDVLIFVLQVGFVSFIFVSLFVWYFWEGLSSFIVSYLSWIPWEWLQTSGANIITLGLAYMIFISTVSLFTSLWSEKLLIKLAKKHYPDIPVVGTADLYTSIFLTLKATIIFLALFMFSIPFLFIPVFGQIVMLYLWSILIKEPTMYDVQSLFIPKDKRKFLRKKSTLLSMLASLFNYLPIANIFAPVFAQILFLHHILMHHKKA
ncbi:MAG TPA: hypothetical protein EYH42_00215 [Sulfurovum sp.]|nr:hypothetical protein [Sulfurovum sp.]